MATATEEKEFGSKFLGDIMDHIGDNFDPDDVFPERELIEWASKHDPEKIFAVYRLNQWAEDNGYTKTN